MQAGCLPGWLLQLKLQTAQRSPGAGRNCQALQHLRAAQGMTALLSPPHGTRSPTPGLMGQLSSRSLVSGSKLSLSPCKLLLQGQRLL